MVLWWALAGCAEPAPTDSGARSDTSAGDTSTADTATGDTGTVDTGTPPPKIEIAWTSTAFHIQILNSPSTGYSLGLVDASADGWHGEDCLTGDVPFCHHVDGFHGELDFVTAAADVANGTTLFDGTAPMTFYVALDGDLGCYVRGDDPSYYASTGCPPAP